MTEFGGKIHTDLWGPAPVATKSGRHYYVTFTDDKTWLTSLYLLHSKADAFEPYKEFEAWSKMQLNAPVKVLHSDHGGEFQGKDFLAHLKSMGTIQKLMVHDTPAHNGVAERRNRTIVEHIRALFHVSGLPKYLWGEAACHVVWLLNRTTTKAVIEKTPFEAAFNKKPNLCEVREWGGKVWVRTEGGSKLGGRVQEGRWLGFDEKSNGICVYWPEKQVVSVEQNVYFNKSNASVPRLEGEDEWQLTKAKTVQAETVQSKQPKDHPIPEAAISPESENPPIKPDKLPKHIRKPMQHLRDLMEG